MNATLAHIKQKSRSICSLFRFLIYFWFQIIISTYTYFNVFYIFSSRWDMDDLQIQYVKKTPNISIGLYGWRKRCFYCLLFILTLIVIINLCLTFWLSVALGLHWVCLFDWIKRFYILYSREVLDLYQYLNIMSYFIHQLYLKMDLLQIKFIVVIRLDW